MNDVALDRSGPWLRPIATAAAVAGALVLAVYAAQALLLLFAGVLFGLLLDALASAGERWLGLGRKGALASAVGLIAIVLTTVGLLVVPTAVDQGSQLVQELPSSLQRLRLDSGWVDQVAGQLGGLAKPALRWGWAALSALGAVVVIAFVGLYVAARPREYRAGFVRLFSPRHRARVEEVLCHAARQLRSWMLAAGVAMATAGVLTGVGLWLLGAPFPLALGVVAGMLEIVPNVGPLAAGALAVLLSLTGEEGPRWWHVVLMLLAVQTFQSYVVQPLTQRRLVDVPPALGIGAIVLLGWVLGPLGVLVGIPLLLVARILVKVLWWRDALGEEIELHDEKAEREDGTPPLCPAPAS